MNQKTLQLEGSLSTFILKKVSGKVSIYGIYIMMLAHHINGISDIAWCLVGEIAGGRNNRLKVGIKYKISHCPEKNATMHNSIFTNGRRIRKTIKASKAANSVPNAKRSTAKGPATRSGKER